MSKSGDTNEYAIFITREAIQPFSYSLLRTVLVQSMIYSAGFHI